jgi:hypothetical protein
MAFGLRTGSPKPGRAGVSVPINLISERHFLPGFKNDPVRENLFDYFSVAIA